MSDSEIPGRVIASSEARCSRLLRFRFHAGGLNISQLAEITKNEVKQLRLPSPLPLPLPLGPSLALFLLYLLFHFLQRSAWSVNIS